VCTVSNTWDSWHLAALRKGDKTSAGQTDLFALLRLGKRSEGPPPVSPGSVRSELARLLSSKRFLAAERHRRFLHFVVEETLEGRGAGIKESVLALEVFDRLSSFDPRTDSVVRSEARNLRARLSEYYQGEGSKDPLIIELPRGSYVPLFRAVRSEPVHASRFPGPVTLAIALVVALCVLGWWSLGVRTAQSTKSIAVLPFLNLSSEPEAEYLTDGFVEELTTALAQVNGLQVAARSSAFQFRKESPDIRTVGRRLGVNMVLEGSVRRAGQTVRISAQLIKVSDGFHVWSHMYEGSPKDLPAIQNDLVAQIARALRVSGVENTREARTPGNLDAYALYLKGLYFRDRLTPEDLRNSIGYLQHSIQMDPDYAPAHAALADAYATVAYWEVVPEHAAVAKARAAAMKALELDGKLAEAHAVLAWIQFFYDWDWAVSEQGLRRALQLNPNSSRAHDLYGTLLMTTGRFDQAIAEKRLALALDPLNYRLSASASVVLYCSRRYGDALAQARQALELNPHYFQAHEMLGASLARQGKYAEAEASIRLALAEYPNEPDTMAYLATVEAATGRRDEMLKLVAEMERGKPASYYHLAQLYGLIGDKDRAFLALDKAYAQRTADMPFLDVDPNFDNLRQNPRFEAMRKKMGWKE
jgi:adenylate cyclase